MKRLELSGQRFGHLLVIECVGSRKGHTQWLCECDCGKKKVVDGRKLKEQQIKSCGCMHFEACKTHGQSDTRLYHIWRTMKARCDDPNSVKFNRYGARGISICKEWYDFANFYKWAMENGYKDILSIDRIDNNGNYEPSNCRWATAIQQANNTSANVLLEFCGEVKTEAEWAREVGIRLSVISKRLKRGWSVEDALTKKCAEVCR